MEEDKTWFAIRPTLNLDPLLKNEIKLNEIDFVFQDLWDYNNMKVRLKRQNSQSNEVQ